MIIKRSCNRLSFQSIVFCGSFFACPLLRRISVQQEQLEVLLVSPRSLWDLVVSLSDPSAFAMLGGIVMVLSDSRFRAAFAI